MRDAQCHALIERVVVWIVDDGRTGDGAEKRAAGLQAAEGARSSVEASTRPV
jgi:hypothetical protein